MSKCPSKKRRKDHPPSWLENESLACVAAPFSTEHSIRTPVASDLLKQVWMDRFQKEILIPFQFTLSRNKSNAQEDTDSCRTNILRQRMLVGTNQCTRALEAKIMSQSTDSVPILVVMARDIYPPTILSHIPVLVDQLNRRRNDDHAAKKISLPILLLPGRASSEMGALLGTKKVAILVFLSKSTTRDDDKEAATWHHRIDSLVTFIRDKLEQETSNQAS